LQQFALIESLPRLDFFPVFRNCASAFLVFFLAAGLSGCGKKEAPAPSQATPQPGQTEQVPDPRTATQAVAAPQAAPQTYDATVTVRSIDYLKGQVARKNWPQVRAALKQLEGKSLTPEQRQYVDSVKAQIPPGQ
jgi:hypothetical protein